MVHWREDKATLCPRPRCHLACGQACALVCVAHQADLKRNESFETDTLSPSELRVDANAGFTGLRASTWSLTVPGDHKLQRMRYIKPLEPRTVNPGTGEWTVPKDHSCRVGIWHRVSHRSNRMTDGLRDFRLPLRHRHHVGCDVTSSRFCDFAGPPCSESLSRAGRQPESAQPMMGDAQLHHLVLSQRMGSEEGRVEGIQVAGSRGAQRGNSRFL